MMVLGILLLLPGLCSLAFSPQMSVDLFNLIVESASNKPKDLYIGIRYFSNAVWVSGLLSGCLGVFILWKLNKSKPTL